MNRFKESYKDLPIGELVKQNPPFTDFVLSTIQSETIGIELTEALHSEQARQTSNETYEFANRVLSELENRLPFTFGIDIDLNTSAPISKTNRAKIVAEVVEECIKEFSDLEPYEDKEIEHIEMNLSEIPNDRPDILKMVYERGFRNLPAGVKRIKMCRVEGINQSWNWQGEGGTVPDFTIEHLIPILEKKHQRLKNYTYCDQFWLIITEGNYFTGSFNEILINRPIESLFNKVFLLRCAEQYVIELK